MATSLQPINPYSKPDAPAFAPENLAFAADPRLALALRKWRDQSTSTGWTFILVAVVCGWISLMILIEGDENLWVVGLLLFVSAIISMWAGVLTCFRQRVGALWSWRLAATASVFCWGMVAAGLLGAVQFRLDVGVWIVIGMVAGVLWLPVAFQAWRLLGFVKQLEQAGIPLNAPLPTPNS